MTEFDSQPFLRGTKVELRPLQSSDRAALFDVAADPLIWVQHPEPDRYQKAVFDRFFDDSISSGGALLIKDRKSGAVIGSSRYHGFNANSSEIEIGWTFLARSHWGGAVNGELKQLMLDHAFRQVANVLFYIDACNLRSQKAVKKIGAKRADGVDAQGRCIFIIQRSEYIG
ncbi:MAG: GNAT family N-acetyltransferase [Pseudomonadota bacterium]